MAATRTAPGPAAASVSSLVGWMRDPGKFFMELARDYGDIVRFIGKPSEAYFVNHPTFIEQILVDHNWNFVPVRTSAFNLALRRAVPTSSGLLHQHQRQKVKPLLEPDHIDRLAQMITTRATLMQAGWEDGQVIDVLDAMMRLTVAIFVESLTGPVELASDEEYENAVTATWYQATRSTHPASVALDFVPARSDNRRYWRAMRGLDAAIYGRIDRARKHPGGEGMLSSLLQVMDGSGMTDRQLRDEMVAFYVANTNTGAELAWIWYLLSQHPGVENRLHEELVEHLAGETPTLADLAGLTYTQQVMNETLRLYPPAWLLGRRAVADYAIGDYVLPAGSIIVMSPYVTQRDSRFFPDPQVFDPDRWTPGAAATRPKFAYYPFGDGPRSCLGVHFAPLIVKLVLATLAQSWRMRLEPGQEIEPWPRMTLLPGEAVRMRVTRRGKSVSESSAVRDEQPRVVASMSAED